MTVRFSGDAIPKSLITSKGDLFVATADNVLARHGVGNNGQILMADSSQADGVGWTLPPAQIPPAIGDYISTPHVTRTAGSLQNGSIFLSPIWLPTQMAFDRIGFEVTALDASSVFRVGVYQNDPTTNRPKTLVFDAGASAVSSIAIVEVTINQTFGPGLYWLGGAFQNGNTTGQVRRIASTGYGTVPVALTANLFGATFANAYATSTANTGAFPADLSATLSAGGTNACPLITLRRSA